jgi:hypothetical protein
VYHCDRVIVVRDNSVRVIDLLPKT